MVTPKPWSITISLPYPAHITGLNNVAIGRGANLVAVVRGDIQPRVERAFTAEWIQPLAEMPGNLADHRPK